MIYELLRDLASLVEGRRGGHRPRRQKKARGARWQVPDVEAERGEFERHAASKGWNANRLVAAAKQAAKAGTLRRLNRKKQKSLQNTEVSDSSVRTMKHVRKTIGKGYGRDVRRPARGISRGAKIHAPITVSAPGHASELVAGNTRATVARVKKTPVRSLHVTYEPRGHRKTPKQFKKRRGSVRHGPRK